jgi:hypothetical protein
MSELRSNAHNIMFRSPSPYNNSTPKSTFFTQHRQDILSRAPYEIVSMTPKDPIHNYGPIGE